MLLELYLQPNTTCISKPTTEALYSGEGSVQEEQKNLPVSETDKKALVLIHRGMFTCHVRAREGGGGGYALLPPPQSPSNLIFTCVFVGTGHYRSPRCYDGIRPPRSRIFTLRGGGGEGGGATG